MTGVAAKKDGVPGRGRPGVQGRWIIMCFVCRASVGMVERTASLKMAGPGCFKFATIVVAVAAAVWAPVALADETVILPPVSGRTGPSAAIVFIHGAWATPALYGSGGLFQTPGLAAACVSRASRALRGCSARVEGDPLGALGALVIQTLPLCNGACLATASCLIVRGGSSPCKLQVARGRPNNRWAAWPLGTHAFHTHTPSPGNLCPFC